MFNGKSCIASLVLTILLMLAVIVAARNADEASYSLALYVGVVWIVSGLFFSICLVVLIWKKLTTTLKG